MQMQINAKIHFQGEAVMKETTLVIMAAGIGSRFAGAGGTGRRDHYGLFHL